MLPTTLLKLSPHPASSSPQIASNHHKWSCPVKVYLTDNTFQIAYPPSVPSASTLHPKPPLPIEISTADICSVNSHILPSTSSSGPPTPGDRGLPRVGSAFPRPNSLEAAGQVSQQREKANAFITFNISPHVVPVHPPSIMPLMWL